MESCEPFERRRQQLLWLAGFAVDAKPLLPMVQWTKHRNQVFRLYRKALPHRSRLHPLVPPTSVSAVNAQIDRQLGRSKHTCSDDPATLLKFSERILSGTVCAQHKNHHMRPDVYYYIFWLSESHSVESKEKRLSTIETCCNSRVMCMQKVQFHCWGRLRAHSHLIAEQYFSNCPNSYCSQNHWNKKDDGKCAELTHSALDD